MMRMRNAAEKSPRDLRPRTLLWALLLLLAAATACQGYSVLTHEAIIDSAWDDAIRPLLLQRFPNSTPEELKVAHSYAYGGCVIQDLGYYPFGSHFFSDLVHYVRTGDFVQALIRDSQDLNEYAFALGALAHYAADNEGHRLAVNLSVPILYPKLRRKYGDVVTYDQNPGAHLKTEFGFDVLEVAKGRYAADSYHDFIGFQVSKPLLEKAFEETYSLELKSVFSDFDLAVGTYRRSVSEAIPAATRAAWQAKKDQIQKDIPGITKDKFLYHISRATYKKAWAEKYKEPSFREKLLAFLFRLIPKIGPFRVFRPLKPKSSSSPASASQSPSTSISCMKKRDQAASSWQTIISIPAPLPSPESIRSRIRPTPICWTSWIRATSRSFRRNFATPCSTTTATRTHRLRHRKTSRIAPKF